MLFVALLLFSTLSFADTCKPLKEWYIDRERGWFFGEWCEKKKEEGKQKRKEEKKVIRVPWNRLDKMHWKEIRKLVEEVKGQAVMNPTYENVLEWQRLKGWMIKKSTDFMKMSKLVSLSSGEFPMTSRGSPYYNRARLKLIDEKINRVIARYRGKAGLVIFSDPYCRYCQLYKPIVEMFRKETGWDVAIVNIRKMPHVARRLGVSIVPDTFVVLRNGGDYRWQRAGTGAFTLDVLKENVVMALWALKEVSYEEIFGEPYSSVGGN